MENCKLCKNHVADKKGSHLIPHFLLKRIDNIDGSKERDKEVGFVIGKTDTKTYFGRSVSPEKLNEVFGEITNDDIKEMKNPSIVDYFFCIRCENRFSQVESEYAKTLEKFNNSHEYKSDIESGAAFLFWTSIVWRMSIAKFYNIILSDSEEEKLRVLLDTHLAAKYTDINFGKLYDDQNCTSIAYRLLRSIDYSKENFTGTVAHPVHTKPYSLIIDEFALFYYFDQKNLHEKAENFFGLEELYHLATPNVQPNGELVFPLKQFIFKSCMENVTNEIVKQRFEGYSEIFDKAHKYFGGTGETMPLEIKQEIINKIVNSEAELGRKYSENDMIKCMWDVLKNYQK